MNERREEDSESRIDYGVIFCVLMLALIGLASIYVAAVHDSSATNVTTVMVSQVVWYAIGTVAVVIIMQFDSEQLAESSAVSLLVRHILTSSCVGVLQSVLRCFNGC